MKAKCCNLKGYLNFLILWILSKKDMNGADVAAELEKRRGNRPSPGTIYPALKELRQNNLIKADNEKIYSLTKDGEKELKSACNRFTSMFFDVDEMFKCCS